MKTVTAKGQDHDLFFNRRVCNVVCCNRMLIGYARLATQDQNLDLQREALAKAGCEEVFEDKVSGTRAQRRGLSRALEMLREGDTLVIWNLGRLRRSIKRRNGGSLPKSSGRFCASARIHSGGIGSASTRWSIGAVISSGDGHRCGACRVAAAPRFHQQQ